jgi:predicted O-methyltransferase YrrM
LLPSVTKASLGSLWPIDWLGLHQKYLCPGEMEVMAALLREVEAKTMIEFGCRDGRTAWVLLHNVAALQRYIGVDVPMDYLPRLAHQREEMVPNPGYLAASDPRFDLVLRPFGTLDLGPQDLEPCDVVFIDGDHSEGVVAHDSDLARALVKPGGVIIWHDANNDGVEVRQVLELDRQCGHDIKIIEGTWLAFERR